MNQRTVDLDPTGYGPRSPDSQAMAGLAVGQVLRDRYVLVERLGMGGSGVVFKARDRFRATLPDSQQYVALKVLSAGAGCSEQLLANVRLEFYCGQVLSHRNVVNVYELDRDADVIFFTMELLDGEPLAGVIERLRPAGMRRSQAWQLIRQLGAGLAHAHERGVVHGDLKPQNILITREGELRILDFGAAHRIMAWSSQPDHAERTPTFGTPAYASCEQLEGRAADPRDDLYALACICYELLASSHPFESRAATLARDYRVTAVRPRGLSGRQWKTLQKGLSWHRAGRSISVHSWMHRLLNDRAPEDPVTPLQELTQRSPPQSLSWRAAALLFCVVTVLGAALLTGPRLASALRPTHTPARAAAVPNEGEIGAAEPLVAALSNAPASDKFVLTQTSNPPKEADDAPKTPRPASSVISVDPSQVRYDDHFAEIRLHRNLLQKDSAFTWWTEPATAKPDVDYVPEAVAIQTFPAGFLATRLYVRLLPQPLRSHRSYFYVAIAQTSRGRTTVVRRQVWLPPSSSLQAQR